MTNRKKRKRVFHCAPTMFTVLLFHLTAKTAIVITEAVPTTNSSKVGVTKVGSDSNPSEGSCSRVLLPK